MSKSRGIGIRRWLQIGGRVNHRGRIAMIRKNSFDKDGFVIEFDLFSNKEIDLLRSALEEAVRSDTPDRVFEKDNRTIRAIHGTHLRNQIFDRLTRLPRLLDPVANILGEEVYVYQFKINMKAAFSGDVWPWHQDFIFWKREDGMPRPNVLTVMIMLDDVDEYNGPTLVIPGSQKCGCFEIESRSAGWSNDVSADLKYTIDENIIEKLVKVKGMSSLKGPAGTVALIDPNLVHASSGNISPFQRRQLFITYNSINNIPSRAWARPEFLVTKEAVSIQRITDEEFVVW